MYITINLLFAEYERESLHLINNKLLLHFTIAKNKTIMNY